MKKPTTKEIIKRITYIRARNNSLWMSLLALAVLARPDEAKFILRKISTNDKEVTEWLSKL